MSSKRIAVFQRDLEDMRVALSLLVDILPFPRRISSMLLSAPVSLAFVTVCLR